ncbi:translation initiation factor IF-2 [Acidihalobacter ferrooxydans]|uniref:Translation initiation factor IF-2 n=1 Tax=Acidihalobacter ferrooxydans TaxID=1765967 RepID=A0A1P8ULK2_9GAMM|nr:translation initiation factor IF-2 [Acidihalobacter ferrooxydans]APZ44705.1 translation initiation factor IF-2 [Acidihalobacter ferrooxydans]
MSTVTVKQLSETVGTPVERLLEQLKEAGIGASGPDHAVSEEEKMQLLEYLRKSRGHGDSEPRQRVTLRRRSTTELKVGGAQGRAKTVSVEVRKKRVYERRVAAEEAPETEVEAPQAETPVDTGSTAPAPTVEMQATETSVSEVPVSEAPAVTDPEIEPSPTPEPTPEPEAEPEPEVESVAAADAAPTAPVAPTAEEIEAEERAAAAQIRKDEEFNALTNKSAQLAKQLEEDRRRLDEARRKAVEERQETERQRKLAEEKRKQETERREAEQARRQAEEELRRSQQPDDAGRGRGKAAKGRVKGRGDAGNNGSARTELHVASDKRGRRGKALKGKRARVSAEGPSKHGFEMPTAPIVHEVQVPETITVGDLAQRMAIKAPAVIKALMSMGVMATINQNIDQDTATLVVEELGHIAKPVSDADIEQGLDMEITDEHREEVARPPVVTIMGHVDHGKTSLLDYIRRAKVAAGEAGGITQHIGAYHVTTPRGGLTFLDTPGHAAFTAMRARGAQATDVVVLVVAADDGVMPQTVEAVQHARAANVPLVVAVNKMDKPDADPDRVKNELSQYEVISEDWGGDTQFIPVSAKTGDGVDDLLDSILLQAEVLELKAPDHGPASGVVVESSLDKGRGPVATVLVQKGVLKRGDMLLTGQEFGRVRAMFDENGQEVLEAGPSIPVQVLGLSGTPNAGDDVLVVPDERKVREVAEFRRGKFRESKLASQQAAKLENLFTQMQDGAVQAVNLLVKADVQGSAEALRDALQKLSTDEVVVKIVSSGVGGIAESDINLALASDAIVIGFNVRADAAARRLAADKDVDLRYYSVIYEVIDDVKQALTGLLSPEMREQIVGLAEVRDVFRSSRLGAVAGCLVVEGAVRRGNPIRVLRDNVVVFEGELESLRRFKDDVNEVKVGTECGIAVKNYNDVRPGDQIEVYERVEVARTL